MQVFKHHLYEYEKGLRRLVLHTTGSVHCSMIKHVLEKRAIDYMIDELSDIKINVFFGDSACIQVLQKFKTVKLNELSDEEDFILGVMLGYDLRVQCKRYLCRKEEQILFGLGQKGRVLKLKWPG